jgi:uncharacterized damage-inducible protein DinB
VFHIHLVQHAFLYVTGPRTSPFEFKKLEDFATMGDVKKYGRQGLAELDERLQNASPYRLEEVIEIPWFSPPLKISVRQALTQAAMHSHYHRGQNATRLRELGGVPPMTDFIVWLQQGQPAAKWETERIE